MTASLIGRRYCVRVLVNVLGSFIGIMEPKHQADAINIGGLCLALITRGRSVRDRSFVIPVAAVTRNQGCWGGILLQLAEWIILTADGRLVSTSPDHYDKPNFTVKFGLS